MLKCNKKRVFYMKVRKKPIVVNAEQATKKGSIETFEGTLYYHKGDYIVTGIQGERYPVKKEIFEKTYEILDD